LIISKEGMTAEFAPVELAAMDGVTNHLLFQFWKMAVIVLKASLSGRRLLKIMRKV